MTTEHTPTPWELAELTDGESRHVAVRRVGQARRAVCLVSGVSTFDAEDAANAAFIVRAANAHDDLLAACRIVLGTVGASGRCHVNEAGLDVVRAAVRKAAGEES